MIRRLIILLLIIGCDNPIDSHESSSSVNVCSGEDKEFTDSLGDVAENFVDLTDLSFTVGSDCIGASITLNDLPSMLTFNHATLKDNYINYDWSIKFDLDNSGYGSTGDLAMSVSKYKRKGSTEKELLILEATQETLWEVTSDSTSTNVCNISAYISGNTFVLYALKSCHSSLSNISSDTKVLFQALINDGVTYIADYYSNSADITPSGFKNPPHRIDY